MPIEYMELTSLFSHCERNPELYRQTYDLLLRAVEGVFGESLRDKLDEMGIDDRREHEAVNYVTGELMRAQIVPDNFLEVLSRNVGYCKQHQPTSQLEETETSVEPVLTVNG